MSTTILNDSWGKALCRIIHNLVCILGCSQPTRDASLPRGLLETEPSNLKKPTTPDITLYIYNIYIYCVCVRVRNPNFRTSYFTWYVTLLTQLLKGPQKTKELCPWDSVPCWVRHYSDRTVTEICYMELYKQVSFIIWIKQQQQKLLILFSSPLKGKRKRVIKVPSKTWPLVLCHKFYLWTIFRKLHSVPSHCHSSDVLSIVMVIEN